MCPMRHKFIINTLSLLSIKGVDFLVPLIVFPILINKLGFSEFGFISLGFAFSMYFIAIFQYGNNLVAVKYIASEINKAKHSSYVINVLCSQIILFFVSFILVYLSTLNEALHEYNKLFLLSVSYALAEALIPTWLYQGKEKMKALGGVGVISKFCLLTYLSFLMPESSSYIEVFLAFIISSLFSALLLLCYGYKSAWYNFTLPSLSGIYNYYKNGGQAFVVQFTPALYTSSIILVLGFYTTNEIVGIFSAAQKFVNISLSFLLIIFNVAYPYLIKNRDKENFFSHRYIVLSALLCLGSVLVLPYLTKLIINEGVKEINSNIAFLAPMILFFGIRIAYGQLHCYLNRKEKQYSYIVTIGSLTGLFCSVFIIKEYGSNGAIILMNLVNFIMASLVIFYKFQRKEDI